VGYHNKYLLGSLESNMITGRTLAKTKNFRGGAAGAGKGEGTGAAGPRWLRPCVGKKVDQF